MTECKARHTHTQEMPIYGCTHKNKNTHKHTHASTFTNNISSDDRIASACLRTYETHALNAAVGDLLQELHVKSAYSLLVLKYLNVGTKICRNCM
jgi:hypothetical protein